MHITDLETFVCSYRFPEPDRWYAGGKDDKEPVAGHFNAIIVRLHTNEGLTGLGEVMPWTDLDTRIDALQNIVRPRLIGRSPFDADLLTTFGPDLHTNLGLAGANIACWDIVGKATQTPRYRLFDRDALAEPRLRCYASGGVGWAWFARPDDLVDEAIAHRESGFTAMKLRIGTSWARADVTVPRFLELLARVRTAVGPDFELMLDANMRFGPEEFDDVLELSRGLHALNFQWFEDPIHRAEEEGYGFYKGRDGSVEPDSVGMYRNLREQSGMTISGGETTFDPTFLRRMIDGDAVDIVNLDVTWLGFAQSRRVATWLAAHNRRCIPHSWTTGISFAAAAHFVAAIPNRYTLEFQTIKSRLMDDLLLEPLAPVDGHLEIPERPGLGVELNEDAVATQFQRIDGDILLGL